MRRCVCVCVRGGGEGIMRGGIMRGGITSLFFCAGVDSENLVPYDHVSDGLGGAVHEGHPLCACNGGGETWIRGRQR